MAKVLDRFMVFRKEDCDGHTYRIDPASRGFDYLADDTDLRDAYDFTVIRRSSDGISRIYNKFTVFCDNFSTGAEILRRQYPTATILGAFRRRASLPDTTPITSGEIREKYWGFRPPVIAMDTPPV